MIKLSYTTILFFNVFFLGAIISSVYYGDKMISAMDEELIATKQAVSAYKKKYIASALQQTMTAISNFEDWDRIRKMSQKEYIERIIKRGLNDLSVEVGVFPTRRRYHRKGFIEVDDPELDTIPIPLEFINRLKGLTNQEKKKIEKIEERVEKEIKSIKEKYALYEGIEQIVRMLE